MISRAADQTHKVSAGHHTSVLQDADRTVITAAKVYKRRIIKDYQIAARCSTTRTKILF
jgi:hypothetical protein